LPLRKRFPVHLRSFRVDHPRAGDPALAAFAEVFWADLSAAGEGTLRLLLRLFTVIFDLRYIPYMAAPCQDLSLARWLRLVLYMISSLLSGPIAGLTAFMLYLLAANFVLSKAPVWLNGGVPELDDPRISILAFTGAVIAFALVILGRRRKWRE